MDLNSSPFSSLEHISDNNHHHQNSCHIFFNSTRDHTGYNYDHHQFYQPQNQTDHENYGYDGGSTYEIKNKVESSGLKLTLWKKEDESIQVQKSNPVKWMSSKMRLMQKMKNPNPNPGRNIGLKLITKSSEDQKLKLQPSSSLETDLSSNSSSYNNNSPIRVCSDCNTTKTPLWRSGPKGPKSLCNACGIRQRKARRAMAAAAAASGVANQPPAVKIKWQHKEKNVGGRNGQKKRCKTTVDSASSCADGQKKLSFEDFLINLRENLSFHRVFPEDEKNAAILLMAISSGLVHG